MDIFMDTLINNNKVCFSYCLYGKFNPKYYYGLQNNVNFVQKRFPLALIHLWFGSDVEESHLNISMKNVKFFRLKITGYKVPVYRFFSIDEPGIDIVFSRDCDSMISEREIKFCNEFIVSPYLLHVIRDHKGHFMIFMAGLFGIKKKILEFRKIKITDICLDLFTKIEDSYILDQLILQIIFSNHRNFLLVHSTKNIFGDPNFIKIDPPEDNNFCGQVIDYDSSGNSFMVHVYENY